MENTQRHYRNGNALGLLVLPVVSGLAQPGKGFIQHLLDPHMMG